MANNREYMVMTQSLFILWKGCILLKLLWKGQCLCSTGST